MKLVWLGFLLLVALFPATAQAGAEVVLHDGSTLSGESVELKEGVYYVQTAEGAVVPVPTELVTEIRLTGGEEDEGSSDEVDDTPTGMRRAEPETLEGATPDLPGPGEQLTAFGKPPARFVRGAVEFRWNPRSDWGATTDVSEFNPSVWYRSPTDPDWAPASAFKSSRDVTEFNPVRWYRSPTQFVWQPKNAWRTPSEWFTPLPR